MLPLLAAASLPAAENAPELGLAVTGKGVEVSRDGRPVQLLPIDGEEPDEGNREYFAIAEDMNFDGFPDVRLLFSRGNVNIYYDWWLWDPETNAFVRDEAGREFSNPAFDQASKTVHVYERGSAVNYVAGELVWSEGKLVWKEKNVRGIADDGENIVVRHYVRDADRELRLVSEKVLRPEDADADDADISPDPAKRGGDSEGEAEEGARETLSLSLRGNPSTGYLWSWTASGDGAVRETDVEYKQDRNMPGTPATYTYSFVGEKEGDVVLRFVYSRAHSTPPDAPVNTYTVRVLPDKRIVLVDMREEIAGGM